MYPVPPKAETQGRTEQYIGSWLARRGQRDRLIIATKVAGAADWLPYLRDGQPRLDRQNIEAALDMSLRRLKTNYIDLYQLHWPDRQTNFFGKLGYRISKGEEGTPLLETLCVLDDLVNSGKVRQIGVSNETP
jgi:aryl-alcohol dehydrogenase-like predicted oxidoreductase